MVKIGSQTIGGIYQSLSPIKTAESESHAASSMRYQNTDLYISFLFKRAERPRPSRSEDRPSCNNA